MASNSATQIIKNSFAATLKEATKYMDDLRVKTQQYKEKLQNLKKTIANTFSTLPNTKPLKYILTGINLAKKYVKVVSFIDRSFIKIAKKGLSISSSITAGLSKKASTFVMSGISSGISLLTEKEKESGMADKQDSFTGIMKNFKDTYQSALLQMMGISKDGSIKIGSGFDSLKNIIKTVTELLVKWSNDGTIDKIGNIFATGMNLISTGIRWVMPKIEWLMSKIVSLASSFSGLSVVDWITEKFGWLGDKISFLSEVGNFFTTQFSERITTLKHIAVPALELIANTVKLLFNAFEFAFPAIKLIVEAAWACLKPLLEGFGKAISIISDLVGSVADWLNDKNNNVAVNATTQIDGPAYDPFTGLAIGTNYATGINRVPQDMIARIHKDEAVIPARYNPYNPNATSVKGANSITININGYNKSTKEIVNELVPPLKLALANM